MTDRVSTKLFIQHPEEADIKLCGVLEQLSPDQPTHGRKIALILHGTMGHKDYLFQKRLAWSLPLDSFRFDFRGNHETGGEWQQGALVNDLVDLQAVVDYLKATYGYVIELLVGHSRGSIVAFRWLATTEDGRKVSAFVNASGRYRMAKILGTQQISKGASGWVANPVVNLSLPESPSGSLWREAFAKQGFYTWNVTVARKKITAKITPEDLQNFIDWDTSFVWDKFPQTIDVLTLHGLLDGTVPPYDALIYARALSNRSPGTHTLNLMEGADHNFTGRQDDVVDAILQWWEVRRRGEIRTGIWVGGIKGKL